jgi:hypothetical protein
MDCLVFLAMAWMEVNASSASEGEMFIIYSFRVLYKEEYSIIQSKYTANDRESQVPGVVYVVENRLKPV